MTEPADGRVSSFGQSGDVTAVDRFGVWLSKRQIERVVGPLAGKAVADVGCGFEATFMRSVMVEVGSATLVDVALAPDLVAHPRVHAIQGLLPDALDVVDDRSLDVVLCMSVIEHLWEPDRTMAQMHRVLKPGGVLAVNVPSWLGKRALEYSAFKLGLSPAEEMDDHEMYYDPRDLWPLMVRAGFAPHAIRCFRHKFGLNTFAVGTVDNQENMSFTKDFLQETIAVIEALDSDVIEEIAVGLAAVREREGRLFILGVGGSAGHASHAVNDFRKICGIESYTPTDNVSELTARANDEGWDTTFVEWLAGSRLGPKDALLVFSVGGGNAAKKVSTNIVAALQMGKQRGASIYGIVGRDGGITAELADACSIVPPMYPDHITPITEGLCAVIWHLLVTHPVLARSATRWESLS